MNKTFLIIMSLLVVNKVQNSFIHLKQYVFTAAEVCMANIVITWPNISPNNQTTKCVDIIH